MNKQVTIHEKNLPVKTAFKAEQVFVTVYVDKQLFGVPVERVQDILVPERIANIPLASKKVAGSINLRGRIVTVIDFRKCLGLSENNKKNQPCTTVEVGDELYSIRVDDIGTVMNIKADRVERNPSTMDKRWQGISAGVVKLDKELMIILDIDSLIEME